MNLKTKLMVSLVALLGLLAAASPVPTSASTCQLSAGQNEPIYEPAVVDGNPSEWANDPIFTSAWKAGRTNFPVMGYVYLRFDCDVNPKTAYVYFKAANNVEFVEDSTEAEFWVKVNGQKMVDETMGNNGTPSDFAFVYNNQNKIIGWEGSFYLNPGNNYSFDFHSNGRWNKSVRFLQYSFVPQPELETIAAYNIPVNIECTPTLVELLYFIGQIEPGGRTTYLEWATSTEEKLVLFDLYRLSPEIGDDWLRIARFPAKNPGGMEGQVYSYRDLGFSLGSCYRLFALEVDGTYDMSGQVCPTIDNPKIGSSLMLR
ncbi:MAG: hypothetical protein GF381_01155 [Candidatus Pacebacteria bacterium]|nr:hypothetical protein [Candidatus Paceibacterota bacterium]